MAIPDVLVTLRFRLVVEILLWNCGLRLKVYSTFVPYLYCFSFFSCSYRNIQISMISVNFSTADTARTLLSRLFSCDRELNSPKLYRCRSLISLEKHFAFRYSPKSTIARACLVSHRNIRSQRVETRDSRSRFAHVVGFSKRVAKNSNRKKRAK